MNLVVLSVCSTNQVILAHVATQHWCRVSSLCHSLSLPWAVRATLCKVRNELGRRRVSQVNRSFKHPSALREEHAQLAR
jgi:hypothetical protein